jgi:hypothetical protein
MKRTWLFTALIVVSLAAFLLTVIWYLSDYQSGKGSLSGMMGQMMGSQNSAGMTYQMPSYVWYLAAAFIGLTVVGVVGLVYFMTYPEIPRKPLPLPAAETVSEPPEPTQNWDFLLRTSKPDERKVLEVLAAHDGKYLQKFIVKETGLSKLKTHRIVSRFAERGIVIAVSSGNTNEVSLSPWLQHDIPVKPKTP